jgi:hypothetical protein
VHGVLRHCGMVRNLPKLSGGEFILHCEFMSHFAVYSVFCSSSLLSFGTLPPAGQPYTCLIRRSRFANPIERHAKFDSIRLPLNACTLK